MLANKMNEIKPERDYSLDVLKGIGILLVVWGHICTHSGLISSFHMPLFFIAVGAAYTYSHDKWNWKKKMKPLLVPYFFFSFFFFLYWFFIESKVRPVHEVDFYHSLNISTAWKQCINIFFAFDFDYAFVYDVVLWFLPCLVVTHILICFIFKYIRSEIWRFILSIVIFPGVYYLCIHPFSVRLPFCAELALLSEPFVYIGYVIYKNDKFRSWVNLYYRGVLLMSLLLLAILYFIGWSGVGFYNHILPPFYEYYFIPIIGTFMVYLISIKCLSCRFLCYLGRNSLLLMCLHEPIKRIVIKLLSLIMHQDAEAIRENYVSCSIALAITVLICIPIIELINRKMTFVLGKF